MKQKRGCTAASPRRNIESESESKVKEYVPGSKVEQEEAASEMSDDLSQ